MSNEVERAREEVIAAAKYLTKWWAESMMAFAAGGAQAKLMDSLHRLKEAERPQPRYSCTNSEGPERVIQDNRTGLWLTIAEAVARLNAAAEK